MTRFSRPTLLGGSSRADSAVLVLHGGQERNHMMTSSLQLSYIRMLDFYWGLRRQSRSSAVYLLRYRVRGWNAGRGAPDPVVDARWALDEIGNRQPDVPIAMLGHSMGGRTAFAVADHANVAGVCALAPWLPAGEPLPPLQPDRRYVIAHGTADRMTSPPLSRLYAERMRAAGHTVARFELAGATHALLDEAGLWRSFAVRTTLALAGDGPLPIGVETGFNQQSAGRFDRELSDFDASV